MKHLALLLAPLLALGAPHLKEDARSIPELSVNEWTSIQSSFVDGVKSLSGWSWNKAADIAQSISDELEQKGTEEEPTIWALLKADPHSFSKLTKLIEFEGTLEGPLDDPKEHGTFFAPNNDALTPPEHNGHGHHHHHHHDHDGDHKHHHDHKNEFDLADFALQEIESTMSLASASAFLESLPSWSAPSAKEDDDDDDDKDKKRKEIFRKIVGKVLRYHGVAGAFTGAELAQNSTYATGLKAEDGSYGGLHRRIKVEKTLLPPSLKLNGYAKVYSADNKAANGYLHAINHPLIPPPSIFEEALLFPDFFSTATSAVQQVHARRYLDWTYDHEDSKPGKPKFKGNPLVTFFLPSNAAFGLLPPRLKFFLFSPFGEHILAKVLQYHAVPETLLLSEFVYHDKKATPTPWFGGDEEGKIEYFATADDPSFHKELDVPTALPNATLHIEVDKSKIVPIEGAVKISVKVNGDYVQAIDVPSRNGAFHVIGKVLVPPHKHHDHKGEDIAHLDSWENWEDWLPAWAAEL